MRRLWTAAALVWAPTALLAATWAAWSDRLPSRVATHWPGSGPADGFSSTTTFRTTMLVIAVLAGLAAIAATLPARRAETALTQAAPPPGPASTTDTAGSARADAIGGAGAVAAAATRAAVARWLPAAAGATAGGCAGIWVATATATLADPADPRLGWRFLYFVAGLAWGLVVAATAGRSPRVPLPAWSAVDPMDLAPTERAAFSTTLHSPLILGATLATVPLIVVLAATVQPVLWPALLVPAVVVLAFGRVRVTADRRGLRLVAGVVGIPMKHIPLADIVGAEAADINPLEWGGWGYRVKPTSSALVLRSGPGLVLHLRNGRRFAVTLDDPRTPAALLTALRARATA
jgi:hypothetical protein